MADADRTGGLQHLGILVDDLDPIEVLVKAEGIEPYNHMTYEPGRRFYFNDHDGIEFEVVAYDVQSPAGGHPFRSNRTPVNGSRRASLSGWHPCAK